MISTNQDEMEYSFSDDSENGTIELVPSDESEICSAVAVDCIICFDRDLRTPYYQCSGSRTTHSMCHDCFARYIRSEMTPGGSFETLRQQGEAFFSMPGELPCPEFLGSGQCDCAALPPTILFRALSFDLELSRHYEQAIIRIHEHRQEVSTPDVHMADDESQLPPIEQVRERMLAALDKGATMRCPLCRQRGIKNDACMHIRCENSVCRAHWCYCCGRLRGDHASPASACRGCDFSHAYIEQEAGWGSFELRGETKGYGALYEFHRRRQAYFCRRVKETTSPAVWRAFRAAYPDILSNVPTQGRSIDWNELDHAKAPTFGRTTEQELLWRLPPLTNTRCMASRELYREDNTERITYASRQDPRSVSASLNSTGGLVWISLFVLTVGALLVRGFVDAGPFIQVLCSLLLTITSACLVSFLLRLYADYCALSPHEASNWSEVHLLGTRYEVPYFSYVGRWGSSGDTILEWFVFLVSTGCCFVRISYDLGAAGIFFLACGTFVLTATIIFAVTFILIHNHSNPPQRDAVTSTEHRRFIIIFMIHCCVLGLGAGSCKFSNSVRNASAIMIVLGLTGIFAELAPRICRNDGLPFWRDFPNNARTLFYVILYSFAVVMLVMAL